MFINSNIHAVWHVEVHGDGVTSPYNGREVTTPLSLWAEINAGNMRGMVRKVLLLLWDNVYLMQIQYDNDWPEKKSRGDINMRQHLCLSPLDGGGGRIKLW